MAKKTQRELDEYMSYEASEAELAAAGMVITLLSSGAMLTYAGELLSSRVDEVEFPGDTEQTVVIRRFCELVVPELAERHSAGELKRVSAAIQMVAERIDADLREELQSEARLN